jgi:RNA ligase (TIGR02306 family)
MSFAVKITKINKIWKHQNADKLDLASVEGLDYQFCVAKDSCKINDEVVYFPIDSLLPDNLAEHLNIKNLLTKNRIKTIKLRGEISQGLTVPIEKVKSFIKNWDPENLTELLGVEKYEPPEIPCHAGKLVPLPEGVSVYDIESAQNNPEIIKHLMDIGVCITEKLEGTNFAISVDKDGILAVCQRKYAIEPMKDKVHDFWKVVLVHNLEETIRKIQVNQFPGKRVTLRGELVGPTIQNNIYKLKDKEIYFFDIMVDFRYLSPKEWYEICNKYCLKTVPILSNNSTLREWLQGLSVQDASNGKSVLCNKTKREGIVIRPSMEQYCNYGRMIIKQRSPEYLASSDL